jgi:hypothetical protein
MNYFLLIFISLLSLNSEALEVKKENGRIIITDFSCSKLNRVVKDLETWTKNSHFTKSCPISYKQPSHVNLIKCGYDITDCVPDHVVKYYGDEPLGPNCWNLALVLRNILPGLRYSSDEEMTFYMNSPLCRPLQNDEKKIPGDIGAIRELHPMKTGIRETHGFIYISDEITYSKNGYSYNDPYVLQSLEAVFKEFDVPRSKECRLNQSSPSKNCPQAASYFRCMSMEEYLEKTPESLMELKDASDGIGEFEKCLEQSKMTNNPINQRTVDNLQNTLDVLQNYLKKEKEEKKNFIDPKDSFLLGSIQLKLENISLQLRYFTPTTQRFYDASQMFSMSKYIEEIKDLKK